MEIEIQKSGNSQVELKIKVSAEEFNGFMEKAVLNLGQEIEVEGFRKGKAPKEIIKKQVGQDRILQEASQECIKDNYVKAVKEKQLEPLGQPQIEIVKIAPNNPLEFKAKIAVLPEIKLPDYKKIASQVKKKEVQISQEEIERLKQEKERAEKERLRQEILEKITQSAQFETPDILVETEKKRTLENLKQQVPQMLGVSFEEYLRKINKTETELLKSVTEEAEKRVKNSLVLREIEKQENIEISEKELEEEMQKISKFDPGLDKEHLKEYTESVIKNEKTFQLLESLIKP